MIRTLVVLLAPLAIGCHCTTAPTVEPVDSGPQDSAPGDSLPEDTAPQRYHPDDYADPALHGLEARLQTQACTGCHGEELTGEGRASSCDLCHQADWREDCVYCHGGQDDQTGAPPLHISGEDDGEEASFIPHAEHVNEGSSHAAYGCETCHVVPTDVLSAGHLFVEDDTAGRAETDFSSGLDPTVGWDDSQTCVSSYCHGDGQSAAGRAEHSEEVGACDDCHEGPDGGSGAWMRMSGEHELHLSDGIGCSACHNDVVDENNAITDVSLHVNGSVDVTIEDSQVEWDGDSCDGFCHDHWYWHWDQPW